MNIKINKLKKLLKAKAKHAENMRVELTEKYVVIRIQLFKEVYGWEVDTYINDVILQDVGVRGMGLIHTRKIGRGLYGAPARLDAEKVMGLLTLLGYSYHEIMEVYK